MKLLLLILLTPIAIFSHGQSFMDLKGNKILNVHTIHEVDSLLGIKYIHVFTNKNRDMVGYKMLTNTPVWVHTSTPSKIPSLLNEFNYNDYLSKSSGFASDMNRMIGDNALDTTYLITAIGQPDLRSGDEMIQYWIYKRCNLKATVKKAMVTNSATIYYTKILQHAFSIAQYDVISDDYSGGFSISIRNYSPKTIKYVWITTAAYNPVADKIGTKTVQAVGPVESNGFAVWNFEAVYYSRVFHSLQITGIKIQYMDGSIKIIPNTDIGKILTPDAVHD